MQDETQNPGANDGATQEPNNAPDPGVAANPGGSEGFGRDLPEDGLTVTPTDQGGSPFSGVAETGSSTGDGGSLDDDQATLNHSTERPMQDEAQTQFVQAAGDGEIEMPVDQVGAAGDGKIEMPPEWAGDPWADSPGETTGYEVPQTFIDPDERDWFYQRQDLKDIEQLDTYEELAAEREAADWEHYDIVQESEDRQRGEAIEDAAKDLGEGVGSFVKGIPIVGDDAGDALGDVGDVVEDAVDNMEGPASRLEDSNVGQLYKHANPDPDAVASLKSYENLDTYEELEADYKTTLFLRDSELIKKYESQQREAIEDAAEDLGEGVGDFVKDIPIVGDTLGDAAEDVVDHMDDDPVAQTFKNLPFTGDDLEDGVDNSEAPGDPW